MAKWEVIDIPNGVTRVYTVIADTEDEAYEKWERDDYVLIKETEHGDGYLEATKLSEEDE